MQQSTNDDKQQSNKPPTIKDKERSQKTNKNITLKSGSKLKTNQTQYHIGKCIGRGRFSHVFSALDESKNCNVAIKIDVNPKENATNLLRMEYDIMRSFGNSSPYICNAYEFGKLPLDTHLNGHYLCMELCKDKNLSDTRKECASKCFGIQKGALIGIEMLLALESFHKKGYVHRDIKPSNFVIPLRKYWENHIYIADFGLSIKCPNPKPKTEKRPKTQLFVGTSLYASIAAHHKLELCCIDDLWSLLFVIIDISTNLLPWKRMYITLGNQSKLRRTQIAKMKSEFIEYMCDNNANQNKLFLGKYKYIREYKDFMLILRTWKYNENFNKYGKLVRILQKIAMNDRYEREQYSIDHSCRIVDVPMYYNFEILHNALDWDNISAIHARENNTGNNEMKCMDLCERYTMNGFCPLSFRGEGQWCVYGYHWTLSQEMHFRNTNELPKVRCLQLGSDMCVNAVQFMECKNTECSHKKPLWNESNTFSKRKCVHYWSSLDIRQFINYGLLPRGSDYERSVIGIDTFREYLNEFVRHKYDRLIQNGNVFQKSDFMDLRVIHALHKLNVSQTLHCFRNLMDRTANLSHLSSTELLLYSLNDAPSECEQSIQSISLSVNQIKYPVLHQRTLDKNSKFSLSKKISKCHRENESEKAKVTILIRLEEFVRNARDKLIGDKVIDLLMAIPWKYACQVLDELQMMGLHKISVIQSAIQRKCEQKMEIIQKNQNQKFNVLIPEKKVKIIANLKPKMNIKNNGDLGFFNTDKQQKNDMKTPKNNRNGELDAYFNSEKRKKTNNYSHIRSANKTAHIQSNMSAVASFTNHRKIRKHSHSLRTKHASALKKKTFEFFFAH